MSPGLVITALIVAFVLAVVVSSWLVATANRLDRLHVRTDAAWAALDAALARRAVVARAVASARHTEDVSADTLRAVAEQAEQADRAEREEAENRLSLELAAVDRAQLPLALAAELLDAEQRVVIARRVHNDAVRDTLVQRRRRVVRWLRLAGTARRPEYFEIVEPALSGEPGAAPLPRPSARVVLVDPERRVLLFRGHDPGRPDSRFWFTVGGGVEPGENLRSAACRELTEETGITLPEETLVGPLWRRRVAFSFDGRTYDGEEWFFLASVGGGNGNGQAAGSEEPDDSGESSESDESSGSDELATDTDTDTGARAETVIDTSGFTVLEHRMVDEHRWWTTTELRDTDETVYPVQLPTLLQDALSSPWDGIVRSVR